MTLPELIQYLIEVEDENSDLGVAAAFADIDPKDGGIQVASVHLENVLVCADAGFVVLQFMPIPVVKESLEIAETIQHVIDEEEAEVYGDDDEVDEDLEDPDKDGLAF